MLVSNASRQCLQQQIQMQDKVNMPAIKMIFPHDEQSATYSGDMGDAEASKPHKLARIVCMGRGGRGGGILVGISCYKSVGSRVDSCHCQAIQGFVKKYRHPMITDFSGAAWFAVGNRV